MSIDILMATYNGERYLRNQLLSLQQQTYEDWTLWIRDDGSTDDTLSTLRKFAESDGRIRIVEEKAGQRMGPGRNFMSLTKYSTADFVAFCDQDDIWFEKKLEIMVDFAEKHFNAKIPCLVHCDAYGYSDANGTITINGISRYNAKNLKEYLFSHGGGYHGCCVLINRKLCTMAAEYRADYYMHDDVVSLLAHFFGRVFFLPKKLLLYRQHASNATGNIDFDLLPKIFNKNLFVISAKHYKERESFFNEYRDDMDADSRKLFAAYLAFPDRSLLGRIILVIRHGFSLGGSKPKLIVKIILRRPIE